MKRKRANFTIGAEALIISVAVAWCGSTANPSSGPGCQFSCQQAPPPSAPSGVVQDAPCDPSVDTSTVNGLNCQTGISAKPGDPGAEWG